MNEITAKIPNDESNWQAIDIYLFSNGQQFSPPRKYHLKSVELNWWDSTLNYLARSHYGSFHSAIELYTLDGNKIEGPLQLIDGNPYVAVVPPDTFIHAGYEKYLIKASRSWEKRQAKRTSIVNNHILEIRTESEHNLLENQEVTGNADDVLSRDEGPESHIKEVADRTSIQIGDDHSILYVCTTTELTTIKTPDDNIAVDSALVKPLKSSTPKSDRSEVQSIRRSIITTPKSPNTRNDRRRSSGQHTAFENTVNAQRKKSTDSKIREGLHRRPITKIPIKVNERLNGVAVKAKNITKYPLRRAPLPPPPASAFQKTATTSNNKDLGTDSAPTQNVIYDKEIIVLSADNNLYKSTESESSALQLDAVQVPMVDAMISCLVTETGIDQGVQACVDQFRDEVNRLMLDYPASTILVVPATLASQSNIINCNVPLEDNYIAVINKGDSVKLTLNIEVQNGQVQSKPDSNTSEVRKNSSLSNIFQRRKLSCTQKEDTIAETESLQSIRSEINECYTKVVVVQCGCCGNHTTVPRIDTMPVYKDENGLFVLMPSPQGITGQTCSCTPNHENTHAHHDKKTMSELYFGDLMKSKPATVYPCVTRDVGMVMSVMDAKLRSRFEEAQTNVCGTYTVTRQVCINEDQCNFENCCGSPSQVVETTEVTVSKSSPPRCLPCGSVESCTQTEWCSVLLEAKLHDDGHYSFHLPPLDVLRYYSV